MQHNLPVLSYLNKLIKIFNIDINQENKVYSKEATYKEAQSIFSVIKEKKYEIEELLPTIDAYDKEIEDIDYYLKQNKKEISDLDYLLSSNSIISSLKESYTKSRAILKIEEKSFNEKIKKVEDKKEIETNTLNRIVKDVDNKIYAMLKIITINQIKKETNLNNEIVPIGEENLVLINSLNTKTNKINGLQIFKSYIEEKYNLFFTLKSMAKEKPNNFLIKEEIEVKKTQDMNDKSFEDLKKLKESSFNKSLTFTRDYLKENDKKVYKTLRKGIRLDYDENLLKNIEIGLEDSYFIFKLLSNKQTIKRYDLKTFLYNYVYFQSLNKNQVLKDYYLQLLIQENEFLQNDKLILDPISKEEDTLNAKLAEINKIEEEKGINTFKNKLSILKKQKTKKDNKISKLEFELKNIKKRKKGTDKSQIPLIENEIKELKKEKEIENEINKIEINLNALYSDTALKDLIEKVEILEKSVNIELNKTLIKNLFLIIELLKFIEDKDFKDNAFQLDDSLKSKFLRIHGEKVDLFFNRKVTSDITNFDKTKLFFIELFEKEHIEKESFVNMFNRFEMLFDQKEDKYRLEEIFFNKETNIYEFLKNIKQINKLKIEETVVVSNKEILLDEEDEETEDEAKTEETDNEEVEETEETEDEEIEEVLSLLKNNVNTEEEKKLLLDIYFYNNQDIISALNKELVNFDFEILNLIEKIYLTKFDKLIQKTIHDEVKKRITSNNVSGIISSSSTEQIQTMKPQKDDLIFLLKREALSYAIEGFLIGIRRFEIFQGHKLSTYSTWWLRQRVVFYIEKDSSLNKATKKVDNLRNYTFDDTEEENFRFHKFDNIKYSNFNFQDIDGISDNIREKNDSIMNNSRKELMLDILMFFCKYKDIFLYHEYLLLKYDIFLENYISFIDINSNPEIVDCFYEDINNLIVLLKEHDPETYKDLEEFTKVTEYHKIPILLKKYFNLQEKKFLHVKRVLKQKLLNILSKIFVQEEVENLQI